MGFAINSSISISAQLRASYQTETQLSGARVAGSTSEPVSLRLALTNRWRKNFYVEPSLELGLNPDAPDFILGVAAVWQFGGK
jgi:hypothetical protein